MDVKYEFKHAPRTAAAIIQRIAILRRIARSLKKGKAPELSDEQRTQEEFDLTLKLWRRQVIRLRKAGWSSASKESNNFQYLRNCPPIGVTTTGGRPGIRNCNKDFLCPWCWGRKIESIFNRVIETCSKRSPGSFNLAYKVFSYNLPSTFMIESCLDRLLLSIARDDNRYNDRRKYLGRISLGTVEPLSEDSGNECRLTERSIFMLAPGFIPKSKNAVVLVDTSRKNIARMVTMFGKYPLGMLFGDPERVAHILEAKADRTEWAIGRYCLSKMTGAFRNRKAKEEEES